MEFTNNDMLISRIYIDWACCKIDTDVVDDNALCQEIQDRLKS